MRARLDGFAARCAFAVVSAVVSIWLLRNAVADGLARALTTGTGDCVVNWLGARAFERGIDPYSTGGLAWAGLTALGHPPTTPLWYLPFTAYDIVQLNQVFGQLLLVMLLVHVLVLAVELRAPMPIATALLAYALVMDTTWWPYHVANIQLSEPIAFLYLVAWLLLRRRHALPAGVAIGLAMTMKPYAALLLVLLLVVRQPRAAVAALATWTVVALAATCRFGFACWREFVTALPSTQARWTANAHNASLHGIVARLWRPACGSRHMAPAAATLTWLVLALLLTALLVWLSRRPRPSGAPDAVDDTIDLPFALFVVASVWLNSVAWEHYLVTLLQPLAIAAAETVRLARQRRRLASVFGLALAIVVVIVLGLDMLAVDHAKTHAALHYHEVMIWLPWPLTLLTLGGLELVRRRSA